MDAIPEFRTAQDWGLSASYRDPLCGAQSAADEVDPGWVMCPLVDNAAIALGCCLDYQIVARAIPFEEHPFRDLFDNAAALTGKRVVDLRQTCLAHQSHILEDALRTRADPAFDSQRRELLSQLQQTLASDDDTS